MIYGLLICAGKQSRFGSKTPKALMKLGGQSLLQKNMLTLSSLCDKIFVVCSLQNQLYFSLKNKIVIDSGKGSGDAVWKALELLNVTENDKCFIIWGDSVQQFEVLKKARDSFQDGILIPCVKEQHPYVQIVQKGQNKVEAKFSKFGEQISEGFHDLSVYYGNAGQILQNLREFRQKIVNENGNYVHKHNNEMEFLDIFNETNIMANILKINSFKDLSFNTLEQFEKLKNTYPNVIKN